MVACRQPVGQEFVMGIRLIFTVLATLLVVTESLHAQPVNATPSEVDAFKSSDKDKNRVLSKEEFPAFVDLMAANGQTTAKAIRFFGVYDYAFSFADKNGDGILTPREMRSANNEHRANN
jgi:Ca2+-binding EF-hand superfamily protein